MIKVMSINQEAVDSLEVCDLAMNFGGGDLSLEGYGEGPARAQGLLRWEAGRSSSDGCLRRGLAVPQAANVLLGDLGAVGLRAAFDELAEDGGAVDGCLVLLRQLSVESQVAGGGLVLEASPDARRERVGRHDDVDGDGPLARQPAYALDELVKCGEV